MNRWLNLAVIHFNFDQSFYFIVYLDVHQLASHLHISKKIVISSGMSQRQHKYWKIRWVGCSSFASPPYMIAINNCQLPILIIGVMFQQVFCLYTVKVFFHCLVHWLFIKWERFERALLLYLLAYKHKVKRQAVGACSVWCSTSRRAHQHCCTLNWTNRLDMSFSQRYRVYIEYTYIITGHILLVTQRSKWQMLW